jgi:peptidoglycan/xylan/chitin deacetylase (PgdA/CDA1 family)
VDNYEHVFPVLHSRGLGGIFFLLGATFRPRPPLANVHKTHFLLSHLGAERFAGEVVAALDAEGFGGIDGARRDGIYRYDETAETTLKRMLNYEIPYPVADRVLTTVFERHLGDAEAFARTLYVSADQVREMARGGMTFGFHTETHRVLARLDRHAQREELVNGPALIRSLTRQRTVSFCYPYGFSHTYNDTTLELLQECGYSMAFNVARRQVAFESDPRFELPRFDTRDVARADEVPASA